MQSLWKKYRTYLIIILVILVLFWMFLPKSKKIIYTTEKIKIGTVTQIVSVTGTVQADPKITLHFQKPGKIKAINVKVGDKTGSGQVLASLDTKALAIQVKQAQAGVALAQANLNLKLAGPSKEERDVAQAQIDSATVAYHASLQNLEDVKKTTAENEKKAELNLANAQVALQNAKIQYDNAVAAGQTTTTSSSTALDNAYANAKTSVGLIIVSAKEILSYAKSILGIDQTSIIPNASIYLGALSQQSLVNAQNDYNAIKLLVPQVEQQYNAILSTWTPEEVDSFILTMLNMANKTKSLAHSMYGVLNNTLTGGNLTQTVLDGYKATAAQQEITITNNINALQVAQQSITNEKLGISSTGISTSSAIDNAKAALDTAQNNYAIAERNLEQIKIQNAQSIHAAQADVDMKRVALEQAQAAYHAKVAKPRSVDIAGLQAQLAQAESAYHLAVQNLQDAQIIAPIEGIITEVNGEVGENVSGAEPTIVMIAPKLKIKANVSETDITKVRVGNDISMTLDAFPMDKVFKGKVVDIDPAETVVQGVIYYQITALFDNDHPDIKSGMTVNLDIMANKKENVLTVSPQAVSYKNNKPFVRILVGGVPQEKNIEVGLEGNDAIEVTGGLKEGDEVILFEK